MRGEDSRADAVRRTACLSYCLHLLGSPVGYSSELCGDVKNLFGGFKTCSQLLTEVCITHQEHLRSQHITCPQTAFTL